MGHPSNASLNYLLSKFPLSCINKSSAPSICEACHKGQHVRLPFPSSHTPTYFPFQLIHCDLWTLPTESFTGFKYYLVVKDDYSRYIWAFPLCANSETTMILGDFYQYALTQFHLPIQGIQCDNGREFDNHALHSFLSSKVIDLDYLVRTHRPKMAKLSEVFVPLTTLCELFCSKLN
jgi:hypothetical protein